MFPTASAVELILCTYIRMFVSPTFSSLLVLFVVVLFLSKAISTFGGHPSSDICDTDSAFPQTLRN